MCTMRVGSGIGVIIKDLSDHPSCPHGPTLLFSKPKGNFYACSACRNRKDCSFFMLEEDWKLNKKNSVSSLEVRPVINDSLPNELIERMKLLPDSDRAYCHACSTLFVISENNVNHLYHDVLKYIKLPLLASPTKILKPAENDKKEAQYLFSQETITTIMNVLVANKLKNVICMGTPTIHEYIQQNCIKDKISSVLLDIDSRYKAFHEPTKFFHYNMFNNHFFDGQTGFEKFLKQNNGKNICIIMDPPFGGRIEPLGQMLQAVTKLNNDVNKFVGKAEKSNELLPIMFVLPYFMEPQIKNHIPCLEMCDYQITYDNHSNFKDKISKHGSPVRIFTNIPLKKFKLPNDNYNYCTICLKWVGNWNNHCSKCVNCTSKNGSTYNHCDLCQRCVKPSWEHCELCARCCLKDHNCGVILKEQACFQCNEVGHKKIDCPNFETAQQKKRKRIDDTERKNTNALKKKCVNTPIKEYGLILSKKQQRKEKRKQKK